LNQHQRFVFEPVRFFWNGVVPGRKRFNERWMKKQMNDEDTKDYYLKGYKKTDRPEPCDTCVTQNSKSYECQHCTRFKGESK